MNAIEQIYEQLMQVFGVTTPTQVFTMQMPGVSLDIEPYAYDTTREKPALVTRAESQLVDQMFDIAKVSGGSNGQRVSSQYLQALSVLIPNFNPIMPDVKNQLVAFLNTPVPENTNLDDKPFKGSLQEYYFKLFDKWIKVKEDWETEIVQKKDALSADPKTEAEKYLEWYEQVAEGKLAAIDEALAKILSVFAPSDMEAILATIASGPGGEIWEATNTVKDIRLASPNGGHFYPVDLVPKNWFLSLNSDINPVDLLKDPEFIASSITAKRVALQASVSQVQSMLSQMPKDDDIAKLATAFNDAQKAYTDAQTALLNTYTSNTVTAIEMYVSKYPAKGTATSIVDEVTKNTEKVSKAKDDSDDKPKTKGGTPLTPEDLQKIADGQRTLIEKQTALLTSSQNLADAGLALGGAKAASYSSLPMILSRLQAQLADIVRLQSDLNTSINNMAPAPEIGRAYTVDEIQKVTDVLGVAKTEAAKSGATAASVKTAVDTKAGTDTLLEPLKTAAAKALIAPLKATATAIADCIDSNNTDSVITADHVNAINDAANKAITVADTTGVAIAAAANAAIDAIKDATEGETTLFGSLKDKITAIGADYKAATANDVLTFVNKAAEVFTKPAAAKASDASPGFMDLQFSFSSSDMSADKSSDTSFSQSKWGVDLFFGSVSHSSSSSSAVNSQNMFESNTEIQIGLKATKVQVLRDWFDPGVFKLSDGMSRLSVAKVSGGEMQYKDDKVTINWGSDIISSLNKCILPAFPTSFLVVKDVTIKFKVSESQTQAMHSVIESKSATGGGFLCFSASSSSASSSDHSSMKSKSKSTVFTIAMPNPQILGWYLEMMPQDNSTLMTTSDTFKDSLNVLQFVKKLKAFGADKTTK